MVESTAGRILGEANGGSCVRLGITVDQQCRLFGGSEAGREVYSGSRFPNSAFLICHRDNSCQISPSSRCGENLAKSQWGCKLFHVEQKDSCENSVVIELHIVPHGTQATQTQIDAQGPSAHSVPRGTVTTCLCPSSSRKLWLRFRYSISAAGVPRGTRSHPSGSRKRTCDGFESLSAFRYDWRFGSGIKDAVTQPTVTY